MSTTKPRPRRQMRISTALGGIILAAATTLTVGADLAAATAADDIMYATCSTDGNHYYPAGVNGSTYCPWADLAGQDLTGVILNGAYMMGAFFDGANLTDAQIGTAEMKSTNFEGANLTRANLGQTWFHNASFVYANLTDANLRFATLDGTAFHRANLTGADLSFTVPSLKGKTVAASSAAGTVVTWALTEISGLGITTCDHASGSIFPAGVTTSVTCNLAAEDGIGEGFATFPVTVDPFREAPGFAVTTEMHTVVGSPVSRTFVATGSPMPTQTVTDLLTLPPGLTFADGVLSGTPTAAGIYPFTITATNTSGPSKDLQVIVHVAEPASEPPSTGSMDLGLFGS